MNKGYSICLNEWATDKRIKSELGLLLIISGHTAKTGVCFASNKYLSDIFEIDEATISRKIKKIESAGYIEIEYEKRGNEITKRLIRLTKRSSDRLQKDHPTNDEKVMYNNTSINITSNKNKECKNLKEKTHQGKSTESVNSFTAVNEPAAQSELIAIFENFRKNYKGTKRGLQVEFKDFKKHKDFADCVHLLLPALQTEEHQRQLAENAGQFFPARKHLKTWLYQRCWENEIETVKEPTEQELIAEYKLLGFVDFKRKYGNQKALQIDFIVS